MEVKEYLKQLKSIDTLISEKQLEVNNLEDMAIRISIRYDKDKVLTSKDKDKMTKTVAKIADLQQEINQYIDFLLDLKTDAQHIINQVEPIPLQKVLIGYYINNKSFEQLAEEMNRSCRHITRLHGQALLEANKYFYKNEKILQNVLECPIGRA